MLAKRQQCYSCKHNVYSSERVEANGRIFHQGCLKCEDCGVALKPKGLKKLNGAYYCKEHHQKNLFAPRPQKQAEDDASKQVAVDSKKKSGSSDVPVSDDGSTQSSSSKERSISFSEVVEVSSGITVSGTFMTVSGLGAKKSKKAAKKQSKDLEKQQSGSMRKRSASFTGIKSGIANLVSSGSGKFKTRSKNDDHAEQDKIVEFVTDDDNVEVENADIDADADDDETDEKKLALQKKIEEMKKRNEEWMKRIANEIGKKKDDSESEASDSDIDTSDITFTTERDATEMSEGDSDTELMSDTSDIESNDDDAEMQRMLREREEELKRKREEIKRKEEEMKRKLEEMKRKEEEVLRKEEELKKKEEERLKRKREAQQRKKVKLAARNGTKPGGEDEELQQIEEEMRKQEEHLKKVEEEIRLKEARIKEKERRMLLEGSGSAEVAVVASTTEDSSNTEAPITDDEKKQKRDMWMKEIDEEVERRRKDKKASQGADADAKVAAPKKRKTSGEPSRRKLELLALLDDSADAPREETAPSSDDSQEESGGQEMRDELVARCTYVWALDKQKKEEEEKKKRQEDDKDSAQRELDEEQQRSDALKKKEAERERKQKEEEWERMQQRVEEELRLEEAKKRAEEERRLREQTLKRRNEAWFRKMEEEMAAREETLRQLREAEEKRRTAENDERKAMGLPPLADSSDSNTSSYASGSDIKGGDDSDRSVDVVVALAAAPAMGNLALKRKPVIPRKPLPPTPVMERERKPGSDLINELAARRAKSTSWDSTAGDVIKASVIAAGPIVQERRSSVDSGTAAAKKASGTRRVSDVSAALELADRKAASKDKRQSLEGVAGKASKKPFLLLRPAIALRPKDKKAKKQMKDMKDMEKIMKKRKQLQKKGANAPVNEERPQCLYGDACKSLDPDHWVVFQHTPLEKREEEEKRKAEKAARRLAKGKERVSTDEDEDAAEREREEEEKRERRLAAQRKGEQSSDSVRALEEEMLKNVDSQDEEAWKAMRKQLARERERKMELAEIEREKTALMTERKRIEFEMSSIRAERKQIEEESRSRIDVRSREKQQERESNNRGRVAKPVQPKQRQVHVAERNNFYKQKLQNIKEKQVSPQKSAAARSPQQKARANAAKNGVARVKPADGRKQGTKKLPAVPRSTSSSSPSAPSASPVSKSSPSAKPSSPSAKASSPSSPLKSLPSGPRSRKEVMKLRESEMVANTKFMAKALQSYKSTDKKHLSFPRGASVRVLVVNEEDGMFYGCCNKKVGWFPSYYVKAE